MAAPQGHIRKRGDHYEVVVPVGRHPITGRYRYAYETARNLDEAKECREEMVRRIADGREPTVKATVGDLLDKWLAVAEIELTTRVTYEGYIERVIRPVLGGMRLRELEKRVDVLDGLMKVPIAKALSELQQYRLARAAPHDQLEHRNEPAIQQGHQVQQELPQRSNAPGPTLVSAQRPKVLPRLAR